MSEQAEKAHPAEQAHPATLAAQAEEPKLARDSSNGTSR